MDILSWIQSVTALANMLKAWLEARKAGLDLTKARASATQAATQGVEFTVGPTEKQFALDLIIDPTLLAAYEKDIRQAQDRFVGAINDLRYTPAQLDQEQEIARATICTHLRRLKEFNNGQLPSGSLERIWLSWRCESA